MNTLDSFSALRRANPRTKPGFAASVEAATQEVRVRLDGHVAVTPRRSRRGAVRISVAGASLAAFAAVLAFLAVGSVKGGPGIEDAAAAVQKAATVSAATAERSGTATVRITHGGELWAGMTISWHGDDLAVSRTTPNRDTKPGAEMLVVDEVLYGPDPEVEGGCLEQGSPANIDPDSGTTPYEYLAAVRQDVGGATLRRITHGLTRLTTTELDDGSTVYRGPVAAGLIAREIGFKGDQPIRVLPFGYVAHDEAADAASALDTAVTVGADSIVREIVVTWGAGSSAWRYTVRYSDLGAAPAPVAPAKARSLLDSRRAAERATLSGRDN